MEPPNYLEIIDSSSSFFKDGSSSTKTFTLLSIITMENLKLNHILRIKKPPSLQNIEALEAEKERLLEINKSYFHSTPYPTIVAHEWDAIHQYLKALVLAMEQAIDAANLENCDKLSGKEYIDCKYDTLDFKPDPLDYIDMTCDFGRKMDFPIIKI